MTPPAEFAEALSREEYRTQAGFKDESQTAAIRDRFAVLARELTKWNRKVNLTAIRDETEMVVKHFLDSLTAARVLEGSVRSQGRPSGARRRVQSRSCLPRPAPHPALAVGCRNVCAGPSEPG